MLRSLALILLLTSASGHAAGAGTPSSEYAARRQRVADAIGQSAMFIVFSSEPARRNGDVDFPYRQDDNLVYLTGVSDPGTTLVLLPGEPAVREVLFTRERNPQQERWTGRIPTTEEMRERSGVSIVATSDRVESLVRAALSGSAWTPSGRPQGFSDPIAPSFTEAVRRGEGEVWLVMDSRAMMGSELSPVLKYAAKLRERYPEIRFRDASPVLRSMREVKTAAEVAVMRRAIDITAAAQLAAMKRALTATNEKQIDTAIEMAFREGGACCWGFPSIVASGANATTLHYERNDADIRRGDLVLTDIGADYEGYTADVTRTYPTAGRFSPDQRAIYDAVYRAQEAVIAVARAGAQWRDLSRKSEEILGQELLKLGLISKSEPEQIRMYYFHGIGHHVGMQVHDVGMYQRLQPGMVIAIEPGIYVRKADVLENPVYEKLSAAEKAKIAAALDRYHDIGVRIEDNVLITNGDAELLSSKAPRAAGDIEAFLGQP